MLRAGFSRLDISPDIGVQLAGFPDVLRKNTGIHDPLYATTMILSDGSETVCLISLDLLWYHKKDVAAIRRLIANQTGIPAGNIMICCTHNHSGHIAASFAEFTPQQLEAMPTAEEIQALNARIADSAVVAYHRLSQVELGSGVRICGSEAGIGGNRRDPVNGMVDPSLQLLAVRDKNKRLIGCIVKYALHPSTMHEDNTLVSSDYVGYLREAIKKTYPDAYVLFIQGTAGDQSNRHTRVYKGFAEAERIGTVLGNAAVDLIGKIDFTEQGLLAVAQTETILPLRRLPSLEEAISCIKKSKADNLKNSDTTTPAELRRAEVEMFGADCLAGYVRQMADPVGREKLTAELPAEVQAIRWNDMVIVGIQGELFVEFGLDIQKNSPFSKTFVVTLANGGLPGYVCTEEAYRTGGYEVGSSLLAPDAGDILVKTVQKLIQKIIN